MAWSVQSIGFLLINLALLPCICASAEGECPYTLEVKTSKWTALHYDPGTKNHVRVRFGDKSKREVLDRHLSEPFEGDKEEPFKAGSTAKFNLSGTCVESDVCSLHFKVEGTDKWKPDQAVVYIGEDNFIFHFFDRYMPENSWDGKDNCNAPPEIASSAADRSMYNSSKIKTRPKPVKKKKRCMKC